MQHAPRSEKASLPIVLVLIAAAAVGLRVWRIGLPVVEPYNSIARQSIVASVARNFYEHGFNFFYPEINENGRGPYLYNAEMPFYSYLMALGYKLVGGVKEGVARSVSVFFSFLTLLFLYLTARRWLGERAAAAALAFAAFSPLYLAISRSLQPESAFLAGMAGAVYFFQKYLDRDRAGDFWISALCLSFAVATKFFNAYLLLVIIYMAWRKKGLSVFADWKNYAYVAVVCASFIWYWKMWQAGQEANLAYYPYRYIAHKAGTPGDVKELFAFIPATTQCLKIFFIHLLTPIGALLFLKGFFRKAQNKEEAVLYVWFFATLASLIIGWKTVAQHSYYQVPFVLSCAFFVGRGFASVKIFTKPVAVALILAAGVGCAAYFYKGLYVLPERRQAIVRAGAEADKLTPKDGLIVASFETSAIQLYYAHRRGWQMSLIGRSDQELITELEAHRSDGAAFFLASGLDDLARVPGFGKYLKEHYKAVRETPDFVLFDLRS